MRVIGIDELSPIGFGTYRTGTIDPEHRAALLAALDAGCNLVDTAAGYEDGASERLIGETLRHSGRDAFVVTKAGYIDGENRFTLAEACRRGLAHSEIARISESSLYSIAPEYLQAQMEVSRGRLQRETLDALLLHNPEHLLAVHAPEEVDRRLAAAFGFLDACVAAGTLRFYGVSSNTFGRETGFDIHRLARMGGPGFRLIELPLNLAERSGLTAIATARNLGLVTLTNRPLNALTQDGPLRLAIVDDGQDALGMHEDAFERMRARLRECGEDDDLSAFPVLELLQTNLAGIGTCDAVEALFATHFFPLIEAMYPEGVDEDDAAAYQALYESAKLHARRASNQSARAFQRRAAQEGLIPDDTRPLSVVACEQYLTWGADHVLVGMRKRAYVSELTPLIQRPASRTRDRS